MRDVKSGAAEYIVELLRERYYILRIYWLDGAVLHSSGLFEHQGWRGSD